MRFLVDTNVLLAATIRELPNHTACFEFIKKVLTSDIPWCLSWVNVYEFLRVATHPRVFAKPLKWADARIQMNALLAHTYLEMLNETARHSSVLDQATAAVGSVSGNFVHDCHIAALMMEHDVRNIVTFDTHFRRFSFLSVFTPDEWTL